MPKSIKDLATDTLDTPPVPPEPAKRKRKVDLPSPKEFAMVVIQGMVIRAGAGAFSHSAMLSLKSNIAKGYAATCEVIEELTEGA